MKHNIQADIKKIQSELLALHQEAILIAQKSEQRKQQFLQEEKAAEARERQLRAEIVSVEKNFQQKIQENHQTQNNLLEILRILPPNLVTQYQCSPRTVAKIDFYAIDTLFERITTDTFTSAIKRICRKDGYYSQKKMVKDLLQMIADAQLFLQKEEQHLAKQSAIAVAQKRREAETEMQQTANHLQAIREKNQQDNESDTRRAVERRNAFFSSDLITGFDARVRALLVNSGRFDSDWKEYDPKRKRNFSFCYGQVVIPYHTESKSLQNQLEKSLPQYVKGQRFLIPELIDCTSPIKYYFNFSSETKKIAAEQIQLIILQLLRCAPINSYEIYFVDPKDRGADLGILNAAGEENEKIAIFARNSKTEIRDLLIQLEKKIDVISAQLGAYSNVCQYNSKEQLKIKEHVLVLFDFPDSFEEEDISRLNIICQNAQRCGIHTILASQFPIDDRYFYTLRGDWSFLHSNWTVVNLDPEVLSTGFTTVSLWSNKAKSRIYIPQLEQYHKTFIQLYRKKWEEGKKIDNHYSSIIQKKTVAYKDATDGLSLPVMLDERGLLCDLPVGKGILNHTLITGSTSSGKSSFLHIIITSIITNYHPDDVELWLVDYGRVEFNKYYTQTPPHVRFISLEKSAEFTFSFLEYLHKYFSQREKKFADESVTNIKEYREKYGKLSMPRIVVMIDEFHNMTQHVKGDPVHREMLENALAEYRKFGLSFIFSNQTVSGLIGLTDAARLQIRNRIALSNSIAEMKSTLEVSGGNYSDQLIMSMERTTTGEVWMREWSDDGRDFSIKKYLSVYINDRERENVLNTELAKKRIVKYDTETIKINSSERTEMPIALIYNHCKLHCTEKRFPLYLGSPVTIDKFFYFNIEQRLNNNVMLVGRTAEPKRDIISNILLSLSMVGDIDIIIYADKSDEVYESIQLIGGFQSKTCSISIFNDMEDICASIFQLSNQVQHKKISSRRKVIFWFGFREIFSEFLSYPDKTIKNYDDVLSVSDSEIQKLEQDIQLQNQARELGITIHELIDGLHIEQPTIEVTDIDKLYDASNDTIELFAKSCKYNIFNIVALTTASEATKFKKMDTSWFDHKILTSPSQDDFYDFGIRRGELEIEEGLSAVYTDGLIVKKFRPYRFVRKSHESK